MMKNVVTKFAGVSFKNYIIPGPYGVRKERAVQYRVSLVMHAA